MWFFPQSYLIIKTSGIVVKCAYSAPNTCEALAGRVAMKLNEPTSHGKLSAYHLHHHSELLLVIAHCSMLTHQISALHCACYKVTKIVEIGVLHIHCILCKYRVTLGHS